MCGKDTKRGSWLFFTVEIEDLVTLWIFEIIITHPGIDHLIGKECNIVFGVTGSPCIVLPNFTTVINHLVNHKKESVVFMSNQPGSDWGKTNKGTKTLGNIFHPDLIITECINPDQFMPFALGT